MKTLHELIEELSPELQREVRDFVEFLLAKRVPHPSARPTLKWWGGAQALCQRYTSVELQHLASEWRLAEIQPSHEISPGQ
mgnify:CR=1 FL=1